MLKISIPTPCHEDWNKMTPDETGRHCSSCAKSVVDFTSMSDEEVKHFFLNKKKDDHVCGRFKQTQLQRIVIELPQNILHIQMPFWKKFLAACLIIFSTTLFSCETKIQGITVGELKIEQPLQSDDTCIVAISPTQNDTLSEPSVCKTTVGFTVPIIKGGIDIVETGITTVTDTIGNELLPVVRDITGYEMIGKPVLLGEPVTETKNPPKADSIKCNSIKNYN